MQRAVSEPTLPTASSMGKNCTCRHVFEMLKSIFSGPSSVQGVPLYSPRSPTISEQSFDDM